MDRRNILMVGVLAWTAVGVDVLWHLSNGDLVAPAAMAAAGVGYVAVRRAMDRLRREPAPVRVDVRA